MTIQNTNAEELEASLQDAFFLGAQTTPFEILEARLSDGKRLDPRTLAGKAFDGYNIGSLAQSPLGSLLGIRKFRKVFTYDPKTRAVSGYNLRMEQTSPEKAWALKLKNGEQIKHGFFDVIENPGKYPNAVMLDYTKDQRNGILDGGMLKDFVVKQDHGLLLGKAYLTVGKWKPMHNYFILRPAE